MRPTSPSRPRATDAGAARERAPGRAARSAASSSSAPRRRAEHGGGRADARRRADRATTGPTGAAEPRPHCATGGPARPLPPTGARPTTPAHRSRPATPGPPGARPGREASRGAARARPAAGAVQGSAAQPTGQMSRRRRRAAAQAGAARLTERRIGLLFAIFLLLLGAATLRAGYLLAFKGGELKQLAATQQVENITLIAKRGTITDRNGRELAVSEDAATDLRDALPGEGPGAHRASASRRCSSQSEDELLEMLADRNERVRLPRAQGQGAARAQRVEKLEIEGIGVLDDSRRYYPEGELAVAGDRIGRDRQRGPLRARARSSTTRWAAPDGEQRVVKDARGDAVSLDQLTSERPARDLRLTLDVPLQDRAEEVLAGSGGPQAEGRDRDRHGPAQRRHPRDGELAARRRQRRRGGTRVGAARTARSDSPTSRARPSSRSRSRARWRRASSRPRHALRRRPGDPGRRPRHQGGARHAAASSASSDILAQSSNVGAVEIGQRARRAALRPLGAAISASAQMTGLPLPGESPGIVPKSRTTRASSIGNLPIGQGLAVTPIQMAGAYAAIANGGSARRAAARDGRGCRRRRAA